MVAALAARARVAVAEGEASLASRDDPDARTWAARLRAYQFVPDIFECLASLASSVSHEEAARLFGAADAFRQRVGTVRYQVWNAGHETAVQALRRVMGDKNFESAWAEGAALSTEEAIGYAQRGHVQRARRAGG